jgi:hypothetical protein
MDKKFPGIMKFSGEVKFPPKMLKDICKKYHLFLFIQYPNGYGIYKEGHPFTQRLAEYFEDDFYNISYDDLERKILEALLKNGL